MIMKRYVLFAGSIYYPSGGGNDFREDFDDEQAARKALVDWLRIDGPLSWAHVWDTQTKTIIISERT